MNTTGKEPMAGGGRGGKFDSIASIGTEQYSLTNVDVLDRQQIVRNQTQLSETNSLFQSKVRQNNAQQESTYHGPEQQQPVEKKQDIRRLYYQSCQAHWEVQKQRSLSRLGLKSSTNQPE